MEGDCYLVKVDLVHVLKQTNYQRDRLDFYIRIVDDPQRNLRLDKQLCRFCFYGGNQTVAKNYYEDCQFCNQRFCNNLQLICKSCAKEKRLCVRCCCDIELKDRRKL